MNKLKLFSKICLIIIGLIFVFGFAKNTSAAISIAGRLNLGSKAIINPSGTLMTSGDFMYLTYSISNNCFGVPRCTPSKNNYIAKIRISDFTVVATKILSNGTVNVIDVNGHESIDSNGEYIYLSADTGANLNSQLYPDIVKIRTSDLSIVKTLRLGWASEHGPMEAIIDKNNQYVYVSTYYNSGTAPPARIIRINASDMSRGPDCNYSFSGPGVMMIDHTNQYLYAGYGSTASGYYTKKISLNPFCGDNGSISYGSEPYLINAINKDDTSGLIMGATNGQLRKYSLLNLTLLGNIGIGSIGSYMYNARATIDKNDTYAYSVSGSYVTKINYATMAGLENFTGFNSNDNVTGPVKIDSNCQYLYSGGYLTATVSFPFSANPTAIVYKIATGDYCGGLPTVSLTANPTLVNSGQSSTLTWTSTNASFVGGTSPSSFVATTVSGTSQVSPTTNTTYTITVCNTSSCATASASVNVNQTPGKPVLTITPDCSTLDPKTNPKNVLTWTAVNPLPTASWKYDVYRDGVLIGQSNGLSLEDTDVTSGQNHEYYVRAKNSDTIFTDSNKISAVAKKCDMTVSIDTPKNGYTGFVNQPISFSGSATDNGDSSATITYAWNFGDGTGSGKTPSFTYATTGQKTINLRATSSRGVVGDATPIIINIDPQPLPSSAAFRGIFVGGTITISRVNALSIIYDSNSVNNPPPGFVNFFVPSWQEVAP